MRRAYLARILIVEDDPASLGLYRYLMEAYGHSSVVAGTGEEGLEAARRERPDLIICDIHLPGMDGTDVARAVKADRSLAGIPLVAVTAYAMVGDRERLLTAGFDGYIAKPINPETFVKQIEEFLRFQVSPSRKL